MQTFQMLALIAGAGTISAVLLAADGGAAGAHATDTRIHAPAFSCRDYDPTPLRLQSVGDSIIKLRPQERVALGPRDSLGVYVAFDTTGAVVAHALRVWRPDYSGTDALGAALPSIRGKQRPISGISMMYGGRPMPDGRFAVLQWGLLCS